MLLNALKSVVNRYQRIDNLEPIKFENLFDDTNRPR